MEAPGTGRPAQLDAATSRWLAWHEAKSHGLLGREIRPLGDAVMLYDPNDREPFWNRVAGIAWPDDPEAFDRRLLEVVALFASLDRTPHVWPLPGFDEPADLVARLLAAGFERRRRRAADGVRSRIAADSAGPGSRTRVPDVIDRAGPPHAGPDANARGTGHRRRPGRGVPRSSPIRVRAIEEETLALLGRDEFHAVPRPGRRGARGDRPADDVRRGELPVVDRHAAGVPGPRARPPRDGGRACSDAIAAGSRWTYLGVFDDNLVARRMYEALGFVLLGGPAPDLLLR